MAPPVSNADRGKSSKVKEIIGPSVTIVNGRRAKGARSNPLILALWLLQGLRSSQCQFVHCLANAKEPEIPGFCENDHLNLKSFCCALLANRQPKMVLIQEYFQDRPGVPSCPPRSLASSSACLMNVELIGIEVDLGAAQIVQTCFPNSFTILQRTQIANMQLHGDPVGIEFSSRSPDVAQAAKRHSWATVVYLCFAYESHAFTGQKNPAEIFAVIIGQKPRIPWPRSFGQFATDQPRSGLHEEIISHFAQQPLQGRKIAPQRGWNEFRAIMSIDKPSPSRRKE